MTPEAFPFLPWPVMVSLLDQLALVEYRRHAATANVALTLARVMGGPKARDLKLEDFLPAHARVAPGKGGKAARPYPPEVAAGMRLALKLRVVSQDAFNTVVDYPRLLASS